MWKLCRKVEKLKIYPSRFHFNLSISKGRRREETLHLTFGNDLDDQRPQEHTAKMNHSFISISLISSITGIIFRCRNINTQITKYSKKHGQIVRKLGNDVIPSTMTHSSSTSSFLFQGSPIPDQDDFRHSTQRRF